MGTCIFQDGHLSVACIMAVTGMLGDGHAHTMDSQHGVSLSILREANFPLWVLIVACWPMQGNLPSPSMHSIRSRVYRRDTEDSLAADASD